MSALLIAFIPSPELDEGTVPPTVAVVIAVGASLGDVCIGPEIIILDWVSGNAVYIDGSDCGRVSPKAVRIARRRGRSSARD